MPIYEYKCANCGNQIEVMRRISDEPLLECPQCHELKLEKQLSLSGFQFKGSGWYVSDYTNRGTDSSPEPKAETTTATETKTENKPDAKTSAPESTPKPAAASKPESKPASGE